MKVDFELIEKESIQSLVFPKNEVLETAEQIKQRFFELNRALILGNVEHEKTKIYFEDNASKKMVETTIWGITEERVILKQGNSIPINRIFFAA